jgi:hypothetical protein
MVSPAFILSLICSLLLTGMAWYNSVVTLPVLRLIALENRKQAGETFKKRSTLLHFPLVSLELLTSFATLIFSVRSMSASDKAEHFINLYGLSFFLLLGIWGISLGVLRRQRARFFENPSEKFYKSMELSTIIRACMWTFRSILIVLAIAEKA